MKTVAHLLWLGAFFVLCAGTCEAQVFGHNSYRQSNNVYQAQSIGYGSWGYSHSGQSLGGLSGTVQYTYVYEQGEEGFVASEFMEYDKAVALGREMLASSSKPGPELSLGEVARALRAGERKLEARKQNLEIRNQKSENGK
jgi:hypothetical protein